MKGKVRLQLFSLLVFLLMVIPLTIACTPKPTAQPAVQPTAQPTAAGPQSGGTLKVLVTPVPVNSLGTPEEHRGPSLYLRLCLETLAGYDKDGNIVPHLATSWEISPDKKTITLTLRRGVKFHDGTDFNAEAVKYNLDSYRVIRKSELGHIESVSVIDDYKVQVNMSVPDSTFITALGMTLQMFSPTAREKLGLEGNRNNPVGTGPFKFVSFTPQVSYKVEKFKDYWQKEPYLDGIEMNFVGDVLTANMSFLAKEADAIWLTTPLEMADLVKNGFKLNSVMATACPIGGDSGNPESPFADVKVRQAVYYAINAEAIVDALGHGIFGATNQYAMPGQPNYNPNVVGYPYNPDKAKQLLTEAGYAGGLNTTLYCDTTNAQIFTAIANDLSKVGINAKITVLDTPGWQQMTNKGWKDSIMQLNAQIGPCSDRILTLNMNFGSRGFFYPSLLKPSVLDAKLDEGFAEFNPQKRTQIIHDIQKLLIDEIAVAYPLYASPQACAYHPWVHDLNMLDGLDSWWTPANVWIKK